MPNVVNASIWVPIMKGEKTIERARRAEYSKRPSNTVKAIHAPGVTISSMLKSDINREYIE